jgi:hypothetical protein
MNEGMGTCRTKASKVATPMGDHTSSQGEVELVQAEAILMASILMVVEEEVLVDGQRQ